MEDKKKQTQMYKLQIRVETKKSSTDDNSPAMAKDFEIFYIGAEQ